MQLAICWSGSSHLHQRRQKSNCSSNIVTQFMDVHFGVFLTMYSIRKLTVSYSDTFKRLINVPRYTSTSLAFAMNATDHTNVLFRKSAYSLMSRVTASPNSIVTAIVNGDACQQSGLICGRYIICIGIRIGRIIFQYVKVCRMTIINLNLAHDHFTQTQ